jgi:hypothetical protein
VVASRAARQRKAAAQAGPLAIVQVDARSDATGEQLVHKIACTTCTTHSSRGDGRSRAWSTYRSGGDNGYLAAVDRWIFHLHEQHPDVDVTRAPCLEFLTEAQQRLHERREAERPDG